MQQPPVLQGGCLLFDCLKQCSGGEFILVSNPGLLIISSCKILFS
jgi:hypothetical protein